MKAGRNIFRAGRREELMTPLREDSYRADTKYHEPTSCPDCGATYVKGRWTWSPPAPESVDRRCPACERIHDDFPAGYVMLKGGFAQAHREEVLAMVRGIARALHDAYKGSVKVTSAKEENLVRAVWERRD